MINPLIQVKDLKTVFDTEDGLVTALNNISFEISRGEILGVVGESGCGKSVTALSIMRLLPYNGAIRSGEIIFDGEDLLRKSSKEIRHIRGNEIAMVFQEPMTSLNPVYTIGNQLVETIKLHQGLNNKGSLKIAVDALKKVGIPLPEKRVKEYPHELSGGMRQRVMIAMALACKPKLLIADEPTTALDVTIQAQILNIMKDLKQQTEMSIMLITHDLGVVAEMCNRVIVMYGGQIVEEGKIRELVHEPLHPYTEGLIKSIPRIEGDLPEKLPVIKGMVPQLHDMLEGCRFHPRCEYAMDICLCREPPPTISDSGRRAFCWKYSNHSNY